MQLQDLSTIQTTLLAIIFGLFIFSITTIVTNYSPLMTVVSILMLFFESLLLYNLLISIFSGNYEIKVESLSIVIWFLVFIVVYISISLFYFELSINFASSFSVNNIVIVVLFTLTFLISFLITRFVNHKYRERFNLLFEKEKIKSKNKIFVLLENFLYAKLRMFSRSFISAIFISVLTGLFETSPQKYGFPFPWIIQNNSNNVPTIENIGFLLDLIIFTALMYLILYFLKYKRNKKKEKKK
jgi:hypothetical protein